MSYNFNYYGNEAEAFTSLVSTLMVIYLAVVIIVGLAKVVLYVIRSLALHTICKRRAISNAWLSWIPVGQEWVIGSLSDQYKYLTQGKDQNRRKILLGLKIGAVVLSGVGLGFTVVGAVQSAMVWDYSAAGTAASGVIPGAVSVLISLASVGVSIAAYVFRQMSMYDLYKSCDPKNAVLFLVFGILFGVTEPFFLLACRNKDGGMPPRKQTYDAPSDFDL